MKKILSITAIILTLVLVALSMTACVDTTASGTSADKANTIDIANKLQKNQPTPTDIDYSLERYNLIRRAYWVNGQREKANALVCEIEKPLGYIVLFTESGGKSGQSDIGQRRPAKTYHEGLKKGYENAQKYIANLFSKHLDVTTKKQPPTKLQEKALKKFNDFINNC